MESISMGQGGWEMRHDAVVCCLCFVDEDADVAIPGNVIR